MQKKIYNDQSNEISDWTTRKLKDEAKTYYQLIYEQKCYASSDVQMYDLICNELSERGIEPRTKLCF